MTGRDLDPATVRATAEMAIAAGDNLGAMIIVYAVSKGVPEEVVTNYVRHMEPPLPNLLHGYAVIVTNLLLSMLDGQSADMTPPLLPN